MKRLTLLQGALLAAAGVCAGAQAAEMPKSALSAAAAAGASEPADNVRAARDAATGQIRAATADEARELHERGAGRRHAAGSNPHHNLVKRAHRNGSANVRMSDDFVSHAVAVRGADGQLVKECLPAGQGLEAAAAPQGSFAKRYAPSTTATATALATQ